MPRESACFFFFFFTQGQTEGQVHPRIEATPCDSNCWKMLPPVIWLCTVSHGSLQHVFLWPTFFFWCCCANISNTKWNPFTLKFGHCCPYGYLFLWISQIVTYIWEIDCPWRKAFWANFTITVVGLVFIFSGQGRKGTALFQSILI